MKMRYPDGLRGQVSKTKTHMVTLAVGSEVVFQGGVTQGAMYNILNLIREYGAQWNEMLLKLESSKDTNGQPTTATPGTATVTGPGSGTKPMPPEPAQSNKPVAPANKK